MESRDYEERIYEYSNEIRISIEDLNKIKEGKSITIDSKFEISKDLHVLFRITFNNGVYKIKLYSLLDKNFVIAERNYKDDVIEIDKKFSFMCDSIKYVVKLIESSETERNNELLTEMELNHRLDKYDLSTFANELNEEGEYSYNGSDILDYINSEDCLMKYNSEDEKTVRIYHSDLNKSEIRDEDVQKLIDLFLDEANIRSSLMYVVDQ